MWSPLNWKLIMWCIFNKHEGSVEIGPSTEDEKIFLGLFMGNMLDALRHDINGPIGMMMTDHLETKFRIFLDTVYQHWLENGRPTKWEGLRYLAT